MGKKSKQKQKNRAQKQTQQPQIKKTIPEFTITVNAPQGVTSAPTQAMPKPKVQAQNQMVLEGSDEYIKTDIRRIVLTLGVLVAILIALVIVNDRSGSFQTAGKHLASFLRLQ